MFSNKSYKYSLIQPVVEYKDAYQIPHLKYSFGRFFEKLIPVIYPIFQKKILLPLKSNFSNYGLRKYILKISGRNSYGKKNLRISY